MLFLDNAALDSCCAERPLHIPTYPRLASTAATVSEKTCGETDLPTEKKTDQPTDYNNPSLRMRARGLMTRDKTRIYSIPHDTTGTFMHSDQMRKDGISESMILAPQ